MKYMLQGRDLERAEFLINLAKEILKKLRVKYTSSYLVNSVTGAYKAILEPHQQVTENPEESLVADRDDPSNLALVLLEALKTYHIKNEVVENVSAITGDEAALVIFKQRAENESFENWLVVTGPQNDRTFFLQRFNSLQPGIQAPGENVENYVCLKKTEFSGQPGYKLSRRKELLQQIAIQLGALILTASLAAIVYKGINNGDITNWLPELVILMAGIFICYNLFTLEKMNSQNSLLVKQFCGNVQKGFSCQKVLFSKGAKLLGIISMTDTGTVYFTSLLVFVVQALLNNTYSSSISILFWCALIPLPYTLYSLYYQVWVVKKMCMLCLLTQLLLWIQFSFFLIISPGIDIFSFHVSSFLVLLLISLVIAILYFLIENYILANRRAAKLLLENKGYKTDKDFFTMQLKREPGMEEPDLPGMMVLGNRDARFCLTALLSFSCSPCSTMLLQLRKMADWFEESLCIKIVLLPDDNSKALVKGMIQKSLDNNHNEAVLLLSGWYRFLSEETEKGSKDLPCIMSKWNDQRNGNHSTEETDRVYDIHTGWVKGKYIPHTPLLIYQGHFLPDKFYDLNIVRDIIEKEAEEEAE